MMAVKTPFKSGILDGKSKDSDLQSKKRFRSASTRTKNQLTNLRTGTAGKTSASFTRACRIAKRKR